ncbi:hypothetical protein [Hyphomicrobium sp.]|uniref:hypothetical protein n=1 Tax=Hyphomicrobium sp. TaxID=82 RepID=UPI002E36506A|nr:hypothetical protein [Hyphomicrobium sp.]HEX2840607.1 hypothetical protein [Hyphomicrobium sp.]
MYRTLNPEQIIATLETLTKRICERFPNSGLAGVSTDLTNIAKETQEKVDRIARPYLGLRALLIFLLAGAAALIIWLVISAKDALSISASTELSEVVQGIDAGVSVLIVLGATALFLVSLESRWRRDQALKALHEFRSIVHVIDMHQLTKDPSAFGAPRTSSSPDRPMSVYQLLRYLGYCSELLSLSGKVAALYADKLRDPVIVDAVGDIERLTANLSQKIWQKIELVQERMPSRPASDALAPKVHS